MRTKRKTIKVAVLGTGFIGRVHVESLRRLGNIEVAAVAGSSEDRAQAFADELNVEWAVGDYREILEDRTIEVVHVCTPNRLHFEQTMASFAAGKHVVCEKPLASTAEEARAMLQAAKDSGLRHCTVYNVRSYPQVQNLRRLCESGYFGDVWLVRGTYSQDWLMQDTDWNWRVSEGKSQAFGDIGTHWCDLAEHVTGLRISSLTANLQTFVPTRKKPLGSVETYKGKTSRPADYTHTNIETEDFASMIFNMGEVARGSDDGEPGLSGPQNQISIEISGSKASAIWDGERPEELWIGHRDKASELLLKDGPLFHPLAQSYTEIPGGLSEGWDATFKQTFRRFYSDIRSNASTVEYPTFEDGLRQMHIIDAVLKSACDGTWTVPSGNDAIEADQLFEPAVTG